MVAFDEGTVCASIPRTAADEGIAPSKGTSSSGTEASADEGGMTPKRPTLVGLPKIEG